MLIDEFESKVKILSRFLYGEKMLSQPKDESGMFNLISDMHFKWKQLEDKIIPMIITLQTEIEIKQNKAKKVRKDKGNSKEILKEVNLLKFEIITLRKLMDSIVWVLFDNDESKLRRLYMYTNQPVLKKSNIESTVSLAKEINKCPLKFALITDLTSLVQIGDLIVVDFSNEDKVMLSIIEVKQGIINEILSQFLKYDSDIKFTDSRFEKLHESKAMKQLKRMSRQVNKIKDSTKIIIEGSGIDPYFNAPIKINQTSLVEITFDDKISSMYSECNEKGWSIRHIDKCLYMGLYDPKKFPVYNIAFVLWCSLKDNIYPPEVNQKYPEKILPFTVYNSRELHYIPVIKPLFLRQIPEDLIYDLIFGYKILLLYLDLDLFIKLAKSLGLNLVWESRKKSQDFIQKKKMNFIVYDHRILTTECRTLQPCMGSIFKMVFGWFYPSIIIKAIIDSLFKTKK